jgi:hypothetical protein
MFGLRLMRTFFSAVIYLLLPLLIISSQEAHFLTAETVSSHEEHSLTAEIIMQKEMVWAKVSMEKHHKSRGRLPLRSKVLRGELYPRPDVNYDEDESIDSSSPRNHADFNSDSSSSNDADHNSVTLLLEPDKASNSLRRSNIRRNQNRTRVESSEY